MTPEESLYAALTGSAGVTALVASRIYPDAVPQDINLPAVAFTRTSTEYLPSIHSAVPLAETATLEVWCMAETRSAAEALASACVAALGPAQFVMQSRAAQPPDSEMQVQSTVLTVTFLLGA